MLPCGFTVKPLTYVLGLLPTASLHWHLKQWLECHCFPILHCYSGNTFDVFPLILQGSQIQTHTQKYHLFLYHWKRAFEKWVCSEYSVHTGLCSALCHCLVFQTNGNKAESFFMCKAVHPKGKTSISMKNSQVTTKKLCFVEAHGFDCMFEPAHCHVSFLTSLNLRVSYSNVFLIIYTARIQLFSLSCQYFSVTQLRLRFTELESTIILLSQK